MSNNPTLKSLGCAHHVECRVLARTTNKNQKIWTSDLRPLTPLGVGLSATAAELVAEREAVEGLVLLGSL